MDQIKIGKFIAALRKEKGLTQEKLGEKLGVTNKTVSRWENGNYMPGLPRRISKKPPTATLLQRSAAVHLR